MDDTAGRFSYRCLPMLIANQAGWFILNSHTIHVRWQGDPDPASLVVDYHDELPARPPAVSHFGHGILTWRLPVLFRTPPDFNLWARGPANYPKLGAYPLEGIVETDWSAATFTMNWKILTSEHAIVFEKDEPICMVVPMRKFDLERFSPTCVPLSRDDELASRFAAWRQGRSRFLNARRNGDWEGDYVRGEPHEHSLGRHRTRLALRPFRHE